jgi:hypothetical protein
MEGNLVSDFLPSGFGPRVWICQIIAIEEINDDVPGIIPRVLAKDVTFSYESV